MENYFSRLALDIIGKAVFNYDFDSLTHDDPIIQVRKTGGPVGSSSPSRRATATFALHLFTGTVLLFSFLLLL